MSAIVNTIKVIRPFFVPYFLQTYKVIHMIVKGIEAYIKRVAMAFREVNPSMPAISAWRRQLTRPSSCGKNAWCYLLFCYAWRLCAD